MQSPQRILLLRTDRIGDVVLTTPVLGLLRRHFPTAHLAFMARSYTRPILQRCPEIDEILIYDPDDRHRGLGGHLRLAAELRRKRFEAALLFYPRPWLALTLWLARIPMRVGIGYRWYSLFLNRRIYEHRKRGHKHELEHNLTLLSSLVPEVPAAIEFNFQLPESLLKWRHDILRKLTGGRSYAIIHPGSGGSAPNLTLGQYRSICRFLLQKRDWTVLLTGSAAEEKLVEHLIAPLESSRLVNAAGRFDIEQLMAIIAGSRLFVATSTGPLHLANAFGVPVLSFYCPAPPCSPRRWGPFHQQRWVLTPPVTPCDHCNPRKCPNGNCLATIPPPALQEFLQRRLDTLT